MVGVYTITNRLNGNMYVGSSNDVGKRINTHKGNLRNNKHTNYRLQNAVDEYGLSNFDFELLVECELEHQFAIECYWYNILNPIYSLTTVNPSKGSGFWSKQQKEIHASTSVTGISVLCTPSKYLDSVDEFSFDSITQASRGLFPDESQSVHVAGIKSVLKGDYSHFKGWHFKKQIDND